MEEFSDTEQKELLIEGDDSPHTILLVEDNEELLQILNSLFSPTYRVLLARNGKEGLEKARAERPDIIVSDVMMPEMSGTEMCLKIKMILMYATSRSYCLRHSLPPSKISKAYNEAPTTI